MHRGAQASLQEAASERRRRVAAPIRPTPAINIAQDAGSGTADRNTPDPEVKVTPAGSCRPMLPVCEKSQSTPSWQLS